MCGHMYTYHLCTLSLTSFSPTPQTMIPAESRVFTLPHHPCSAFKVITNSCLCQAVIQMSSTLMSLTWSCTSENRRSKTCACLNMPGVVGVVVSSLALHCGDPGSAYRQFGFMPKMEVHTCYNILGLRTEVLCTLSSTQAGFELMTSRSRQYISCHWDACS